MITKIKGSSLLRTKHTHSLFGFLNSLNDDENITGKHTELSLLTVSHPLTCPAVSASGGIRLHFEHEFLSFFLSGASHFLHCIHSEGKKDLINVISYSEQFAIGNYTITLYK